MAYFLDNYPVSEDSNLLLTKEQEDSCRVVYKLDENGGAYFSELWDPDKEYSDEHVILRLRSTGGTPDLIPQNTEFVNVIGSKKDTLPKGKRSWIGFWREMTKTDPDKKLQCCTDKNFYLSGRGGVLKTVTYPIFDEEGYVTAAEDIDAVCSSKIIGGHIRKRAASRNSDPVYIAPICENHNVCYIDGCPVGMGFYMKFNSDTPVIKLEGYLNNVQTYIDQLKKEDDAVEK